MGLNADLLVNVSNDVATAVISVVTAVVISYGLTRSIKRSDMRVAFSERWLTVMARVHDINRAVLERKARKPTELEDELTAFDARECFRNFFTLMFDEFMSYRESFLDRHIFEEWMTFNMELARRQAAAAGSYSVGTTTYLQGWADYKEAYPFVDKDFKAFLDAAHEAGAARDAPERLSRIIARYGRGLPGATLLRPKRSAAAPDQVGSPSPTAT